MFEITKSEMITNAPNIPFSSQSTPSKETELIHVHKPKFGPTNQQTKNTIRDGGRTPLYTSYTVYTFCTVYTVPTDAVKQY